MHTKPPRECFDLPLSPYLCSRTGAWQLEIFSQVGQVGSTRRACHWWNRKDRPTMVRSCFGLGGSVKILCIFSLLGRRLLAISRASRAVIRCSRISDASDSFGSVLVMISSNTHLIWLIRVTLPQWLCFLFFSVPAAMASVCGDRAVRSLARGTVAIRLFDFISL